MLLADDFNSIDDVHLVLIVSMLYADISTAFYLSILEWKTNCLLILAIGKKEDFRWSHLLYDCKIANVYLFLRSENPVM